MMDTMGGGWRGTGARYAVLGLLFVAPSGMGAQEANAWRGFFAAGEQARQAEDHDAYAEQMAQAARATPAGLLNRPFIQYHAARAAALVGNADEAVAWLEQAWEENIESLMISFAAYDPAFESISGSPEFVRVMGLAADMELTVQNLAGAVYLISGTGSNVLAHVGSDGVFLIDTGYLPALPALRRTLASLSPHPVRQLLITHPHEDHMGAAAAFGTDARVIAHPATTAAMDEPYVFMEGVEMPPKAASARPDLEVATDTAFAVNGEEVRVLAFPAHTSGDLVVYFTDAHVAHFGDAYLGANPMMFPGTTDPDAFLDRMESALASMHPKTIVVGGHEGVVGLAEVRAQIEATRGCMALVRQALEEGLTTEETAARAEGTFAPQWVGFFYRLFSAG